MSDEKSPLDSALDLLVYAPLGLALSARELLPELVKRGRQQVANQAQMARFVGQMAMQMGQKEAEKRIKEGAEQAGGLLSALGVRPPAERPKTTAATSTPSGPPRPAPAPNAAAAGVRATNGASATGTPLPQAKDLAIPGYDTLSAPQVVQRLAGLTTGELDAVRTYEGATRQRKTILNKVAQLQSAIA